MVDREIAHFISSNLKRGISYNEIHSQLLARGYSDFEINEARDALLTGQKLDSSTDIAESRLGVKWFFYTIGIIGFVVFMFIIFGVIFSNIKPTKFSIDEASLVEGVFINATQNTVLDINSYKGQILEIDVSTGIDKASFTGDLGSFVLKDGSSRMFDVDSDNYDDLKIMYYLEDDIRIIYLQGTCSENWICTEWTQCLNGRMLRTCSDRNDCGTDLKKPSLERECQSNDEVLENWQVETDYNYTEEEEVNQTTNEENITTEENTTEEYVVVSKIVSADFIREMNTWLDMGDPFVGNYSLDVELSNISVNFLVCYNKDDFDGICEEEIFSTESESETFNLNGNLSSFYMTDSDFIKRDSTEGFNETGSYRYYFFLYSCSFVNDQLGISDCSVSYSDIVDTGSEIYGKSFDLGLVSNPRTVTVN